MINSVETTNTTNPATVSLCGLAVFAIVVVGIDIDNINGQSDVASLWVETLSEDVKKSILWHADHEEGDLTDWQDRESKHPGGGVLNTCEDEVIARATTRQAHSGRYSAEATITGALRAGHGNRAVRLMRWTDRPWDQGGSILPKAAYYSTWMYFPRTYNSNKYPPWDPGDGGWWNVFQFKANDDDDVSQPVWALNVYHNDDSKKMQFYLYSAVNKPTSIDQTVAVPVPIRRWFHVEAYYRVDAGHGGEIVVWQDGREILRGTNVRTAISKAKETPVWGIGNYTDHIAGDTVEGTSTVYFDDCIISTERISVVVAD